MDKKEMFKEFVGRIASKGNILTLFIKSIFDYEEFYDYSYLFRMKEEGNTEIIDIYDNVSDNRFNRYMFIFDKGEYDIRVIEECNVFVSYIYVYNVVDSKDKLLKLAYLFNLDNDLMVEYAKSFLPDKIIQILIKVIKKANK